MPGLSALCVLHTKLNFPPMYIGPCPCRRLIRLIMPRIQGKSRPPRPIEWDDASSSGIMRNAFVLTINTQAVMSNHPALKRTWRIRNAWLAKGKGERGNLPPGALRQQKSGKTFQRWHVVPGPGGRRPAADKDARSIYAIVILKNWKTYVGRTIKSPYVKFHEHISTTDAPGREIKADQIKFVVVLLEIVPRCLKGVENSGTPLHWRERENSWINRLHTRVEGYNTRWEVAKPQPPQIPTHGFGVKRVRRSRHKSRITKITHNGRVLLSRGWQRRMNYFAGLVSHRHTWCIGTCCTWPPETRSA